MKKIFLVSFVLFTFVLGGFSQSFDIGNYHTIVMDSLFGKRDFNPLNNNDVFNEIYLIASKKEPNLFNSSVKSTVNPILGSLMNELEINFLTFSKDDLYKSLVYLKTNNLVSNIVYEKLFSIYNAATIGTTPENIRTNVLSFKNLILSGNDKIVMDAFIDVYLDSYDFWQNHGGVSAIGKFNWCNVADAVGAAMGVVAAGPFGGAFLSIGYSFMTDLIVYRSRY